MTHLLIKKAFERDIGTEAISIHPCENLSANLNNVYRIETEDRPFIFKLYRSPGYPEEGKMLFVAKKLAEHNIPHAEICSYNRRDDDLPNGYIIEECLPGTTADRLALSEEETCGLYKKLALLMSEIHQIKFTGCGFIERGAPDCATFTQHIEDNFIYGPNRMQSVYTDAQLHALKRLLLEKLRPCDDMQPCLCHIDLQLKNTLVDGDTITLIDWDDARSFPALVDIARLTLLIELAYDNEKPENREKAEIYKRAFLDNYRSDDVIQVYRELEPALHVWHGLVLLNFCAGGTPQFDKIKRALGEKVRRM